MEQKSSIFARVTETCVKIGPHHEKKGFLPIGKQSRRSALQLVPEMG